MFGAPPVFLRDVPHQVCAPTGESQLLDFVVRRLRRVVRSTFAAELNALVDALETMLLLQLMFHQILCGTSETSTQLVERLENGTLHPPIELCVDAQSVFDAIYIRKQTANIKKPSLLLNWAFRCINYCLC